MSGSQITYEQAIDWIFGLINYERKPGRSRDFRLDRTRKLLEAVGNPHQEIPAVHIAGTKGKGSTACMCSAALFECGVTTGLFTSPHITRFEERIRVNGAEPTQTELVELVEELQAAVEKCDGLMPTYFEAAMVLAWCFFRRRQVQIAVLEVGLGGRLDATNVCLPAVCVLTSISLDHTNVLGDTLDKIAAEKAGIIKAGIPVISGVTAEPARSVIRQVAARHGCQLTEASRDVQWDYTPPKAGQTTGVVSVSTPWNQWDRVSVPLPGAHQAFNTMLTLATMDLLSEKHATLAPDCIQHGLSQVSAPGRIEVLSREPLTIVDAAHNEASIEAFVKTLDEISTDRPRICIFATTQQKAVASMLGHILPAFDHLVLTNYLKNPRAVPADELERVAVELSGSNALLLAKLHVAPTPQAALGVARTVVDEPAMLCTTGSFFIAAEIRELLWEQTAKKKAD